MASGQTEINIKEEFKKIHKSKKRKCSKTSQETAAEVRALKNLAKSLRIVVINPRYKRKTK